MNTIPETLRPFQAAAKKAAEARESLAAELAELDADLRAIQKQHQRAINHYAKKYADANSALIALVSANSSLFLRPKSQTLHGVKFGFKKGQGSLKFANQDNSVALIKKHFPDKADLLIDRKETPNKTAAANLPANDLKKIGGSIVQAENAAFTTYPKTDVNKMIDAVMKDLSPT